MAKLNNQISDKIMKQRLTRIPHEPAPLVQLIETARELSFEAERLIAVDDMISFNAASILLGLKDRLQGLALLLSHGIIHSALQQGIELSAYVRQACRELGQGEANEIFAGAAADHEGDDDDAGDDNNEVEGDDDDNATIAEKVKLVLANPAMMEHFEVIDDDDDDDDDEFEDFDDEEGTEDDYPLLPGNFEAKVNLLASEFTSFEYICMTSGLGTLTELNGFDSRVIEDVMSADDLSTLMCDSVNETVHLLVLPLARQLGLPRQSGELLRQRKLMELAFHMPEAVASFLVLPDEQMVLDIQRDLLQEAGVLSGDDSADINFIMSTVRENPILAWAFDEQQADKLLETAERVERELTKLKGQMSNMSL